MSGVRYSSARTRQYLLTERRNDLDKSAGFGVGLAVGIILVVLLLKFANTDHKKKTEYDERQKEIRGRGYMYGFYTMIIYETIMICFGMSGVTLPVAPIAIHFTGIVLGGVVLASYCIWKDAYWGLNNNLKRYAIVFLATAALNAIPLIASVKSEGFNLEDGPILNLICLVMLGVLGVEFLVKYLMDKGGAEE